MKINQIRKMHLMVAEWIDAWRLVPRALVAGYGYLVYDIVQWYQSLHPYMLKGCTSQVVSDCIVQAPTSQHAVIVTAIITLGAAVFGFYSNTGKDWSKGIPVWKEKDDESNNSSS